MEHIAVITGASQGFGLALAEALADRGWSLVVDARRADLLERATRDLRSRSTVVAIPGDVTDPAHRAELARAAADLGRVDLVVNNASTLGASPLPALDAIDPAVLREVFEVNAIAPIALIQALLPTFAARPIIVNLSSDAAVEAYETWGGYGASKAALDHLSRILAVEHPDWRVLAVDPGDMRTQMHQDAFPGEDIADRPPPETPVPALLALLDRDPPSGRYRLGDVGVEPEAADRDPEAITAVDVSGVAR